MEQQQKELWEAYRATELLKVSPLLAEFGFALDDIQVHTSGERYLMSGRKLVLKGRRVSDSAQVIIKFSSDPKGIEEIVREHTARDVLHHLDFAYRNFFSPEELVFVHRPQCALAVTAFVVEERSFLEHPLKEQFFLALRAFETQEGLHVTTDAHARAIRGVFGSAHAADYLNEFSGYAKNCHETDMDHASQFLEGHRELIERYCDFLTHTDFVPHNLRIVGRDIYLLDHSSIRFGNKYESWARFLNYMVIYHPELEHALMRYVRENRGEEYDCLRAMRVFKLGYLIDFYVRSLDKTTGDLHALSVERIGFWSKVLRAVLDDVPIPDHAIQEYRNTRDRLRSEEEKARQKELRQQ